MARLPRLIVDGLPHLISQRVQYEQTLARDPADRDGLVERLKAAAAEHGVQVHAYAVADDRFDLLATPKTASALSRYMQAVARRHSADFNRRHGRAGGLWAGRYRVAVFDPQTWLLPCMCFVEQLLHRSKAAPQLRGANPESSESHHTGARIETWLVDLPSYWELGNTPFERGASYRALVESAMPRPVVEQIESALRGGWALGGSAFTAQFAAQAMRPLTRRSPGRPRLTVRPEE